MSQAKEDCNEAGNWLVEDNPSDTITHCADVLAFLAFSVSQNDPAAESMGQNAKEGFFCVVRSVEDALRWEADRVQLERREPRGGER